MRFENSYAKLNALVVDDMATQQTTLRGQLASLGLEHIDAASSADDALRQIRAKRYQLILCDYNLSSRTDGQQLFELLREQGLLGTDCLFFMVTAEANYSAVAAASEQVPDAYLLKPITAGDIEDRLKSQLEKRQALLPITQAIGRNDLGASLAAAETLLARKDRWFMQALQHKAQLQLQLGMVDEARGVYEQALQLRPGLVWAQVGVLRTHKASGNHLACRDLAEQILATREGAKNIAACDLLAQSLESLGDQAGALAVARRAAELLPSSRRQRRLGEAAYRNGDLATAKQAFTKAWKASQSALTAQPQDALALAQIQVELGEPKEALALLKDAAARGTRGGVFDQVALAIKAQALVAEGQPERARMALKEALAGGPTGKSDFATLALARAAMVVGQQEVGMSLLRAALCADHENARMLQLVSKTMTDLGKGEQLDALIEASVGGLKTRLFEAKRLLRGGKLDEALEAIEAELKEFPDNTTVLLECAQMNCLWMRMNKNLDSSHLDRVRGHLARLETLLPGHERVAQMRRYLRETLAQLQPGAFSISADPGR